MTGREPRLEAILQPVTSDPESCQVTDAAQATGVGWPSLECASGLPLAGFSRARVAWLALQGPCSAEWSGPPTPARGLWEGPSLEPSALRELSALHHHRVPSPPLRELSLLPTPRSTLPIDSVPSPMSGLLWDSHQQLGFCSRKQGWSVAFVPWGVSEPPVGAGTEGALCERRIPPWQAPPNAPLCSGRQGACYPRNVALP